MCTILKSDLIVATAFRDRYEFWKPLFDTSDEKQHRELVNFISVSLKDCLDKQFLCENSALGNVFAQLNEKDFYEYFYNHSEYFIRDSKGRYTLNPDAVKSSCGSFDLNVFFSKLLNHGIYSNYVLHAFNFTSN